jgi:hypothetical protein
MENIVIESFKSEWACIPIDIGRNITRKLCNLKNGFDQQLPEIENAKLVCKGWHGWGPYVIESYDMDGSTANWSYSEFFKYVKSNNINVYEIKFSHFGDINEEQLKSLGFPEGLISLSLCHLLFDMCLSPDNNYLRPNLIALKHLHASGFNESNIKFIRELSSLTSFGVALNGELHDRISMKSIITTLYNPNMITTMSLECQYYTYEEELCDIAKYLPNMKTLVLRSCVIQAITKRLPVMPSLTSLDISHTSFYENFHMANLVCDEVLPKLKFLDISGLPRVGRHVSEVFTLNRLSLLASLKMHSSTIRDEELLDIVSANTLPELVHLDMKRQEYGVTLFTKEGILKVVEAHPKLYMSNIIIPSVLPVPYPYPICTEYYFMSSNDSEGSTAYDSQYSSDDDNESE